MNQAVVFIIIVLAVVFGIVASSYLHKRHKEYKMSDIEKAVRKAYSGDTQSIDKEDLLKAIKKHFHCSSKEAHYILGVARRKKLVDIEAGHVTLLS